MTEQIEKKLDAILSEVQEIKTLITGRQTSTLTAPPEQVSVRRLSIREFINTLKLSNDVDKTLALGYFLEKHRGQVSFNKKDIAAAYREAKEVIPQNINDKVNMNIKNAFIMEAVEKKDNLKSWTLTATGEEQVANVLGKKQE